MGIFTKDNEGHETIPDVPASMFQGDQHLTNTHEQDRHLLDSSLT